MTLPDLDPSNIGQVAFYQTNKADPVGDMKQFLDTYEEYSNGVDGIIQLTSDLFYEVRVRIKDDGYIIAYTPDTELYKSYSEGEKGFGIWTTSVESLNPVSLVPNDAHNGAIFGAISSLLGSAYGNSLDLEDGVGYYSYLYPDATNLSIFTGYEGINTSYTSGVNVEIHTLFHTSGGDLVINGGEFTQTLTSLEAFKIPSEYGGGSTIESNQNVGFTSLWR